MMVGDNIYHRLPRTRAWQQEDSHHSNPDGTPNPHNVINDTKADRVLLSTEFFYFGRNAPTVPRQILEDLGYVNTRNYRVFTAEQASALVDWLRATFGRQVNLVLGAPFDFEGSARRYSAGDNKIH
jgi:hypothetical protein